MNNEQAYDITANFINNMKAANFFDKTPDELARHVIQSCMAARYLADRQIDECIELPLSQIALVTAELDRISDEHARDMGTFRLSMMAAGVALCAGFELTEEISNIITSRRYSTAIKNLEAPGNYIHHPLNAESETAPVEPIHPSTSVRDYIYNLPAHLLLGESSTEGITAMVMHDCPESKTFSSFIINLIIENKRTQFKRIQEYLNSLSNSAVLAMGKVELFDKAYTYATNINVATRPDIMQYLVEERMDNTRAVAEEPIKASDEAVALLQPVFQAVMDRQPHLYPLPGVVSVALIDHVLEEYGVDLYNYEYNEILAVAEITSAANSNPITIMPWSEVEAMLRWRGYKIIGRVMQSAESEFLFLQFTAYNNWEYSKEKLNCQDIAMLIYDYLGIDSAVCVLGFTPTGIEYRIKG